MLHELKNNLIETKTKFSMYGRKLETVLLINVEESPRKPL